jgi:hypothetical protein
MHILLYSLCVCTYSTYTAGEDIWTWYNPCLKGLVPTLQEQWGGAGGPPGELWKYWPEIR